MSLLTNVVDFGADPTGYADSTAAFQSALLALNYSTHTITGYPILPTTIVPRGTYRLDSTVYVNSIRLVAEPGCVLERRYDALSSEPMFVSMSSADLTLEFSGAHINFYKDAPYGVISIAGVLNNPDYADRWQIRNLVINQRWFDLETAPDVRGIVSCGASTNGLIENVTVVGGTEAFLLTQGTSGMRLTNLLVTDCSGSAFRLQGVCDNSFSNLTIATAGGTDPYIWLSPSMVGADRNHFSGVTINDGTYGRTGVHIEENCVHNCVEYTFRSAVPSAALQLDDARNTVIQGTEADMLRLRLNEIDTFANEAAAATAGLAAGELYKTSTGEMRVKL